MLAVAVKVAVIVDVAVSDPVQGAQLPVLKSQQFPPFKQAQYVLAAQPYSIPHAPQSRLAQWSSPPQIDDPQLPPQPLNPQPPQGHAVAVEVAVAVAVAVAVDVIVAVAVPVIVAVAVAVLVAVLVVVLTKVLVLLLELVVVHVGGGGEYVGGGTTGTGGAGTKTICEQVFVTLEQRPAQHCAPLVQGAPIRKQVGVAVGPGGTTAGTTVGGAAVGGVKVGTGVGGATVGGVTVADDGAPIGIVGFDPKIALAVLL